MASPSKKAFFEACGSGDINEVMRLNPDDVNVKWEPEKDGYGWPDGYTPLHIAANTKLSNMVEWLVERSAEVNAVDKEKWTPLHVAAEKGNIWVVKALIDKGARLEAQDEHGRTPLHVAVENEQADAIRVLLENGANVEAVDEYNRSPLHSAAVTGNVEAIGVLLDKGANTEARNERRKTPLHAACQSGKADAIKALLEKGARIEALDVDGRTALHYADNKDSVSILVDNGADIEARDCYGRTPLHSTNTESVARILIALGADLAAKDWMGWTPLHWACFNGRWLHVMVLIAAGADVNVRTTVKGASSVIEIETLNNMHIEGWRYLTTNWTLSPLHLACLGETEEHLKVVKLLLLYGALVNVTDTGKNTPLHATVVGIYETLLVYKNSILRILLQAHANPNAENTYGLTPFHLACKSGLYGVVKIMLEHGVDPKAVYKDKRTPLHLAFESEQYDVAITLLDHGVDPNAVDKDKRTPLHLACESEKYDVVMTLLDHGADPNAVDKDKRTPLHLACESEQYDVVMTLLDHGADPNAVDKDKRTPLHLACESEQYDVVMTLLEHGADPKAVDKDKRTPLHLACESEKYDVVMTLLDHGADPNAVDKDKRTPLYLVGGSGQHAEFTDDRKSIAMMLLDRKCDIEARDNRGRTPLHIGCLRGLINFAKFLLENGASVNSHDNEKYTPLSLAASMKYSGLCTLLLSHGASSGVSKLVLASTATEYIPFTKKKWYDCFMLFCDDLIGALEPSVDDLLKKCQEKGILSEKQVAPIKRMKISDSIKAEKLCEELCSIRKERYVPFLDLLKIYQPHLSETLTNYLDDFHWSSIDDSTIDVILRNTTRKDWAQCLDGMCSTFSDYLQIEFGLLDECISKEIVNYKQYRSIKNADVPANALLRVLRGIDMAKYPKFLKTLKAYHFDFAKDMIEYLGSLETKRKKFYGSLETKRKKFYGIEVVKEKIKELSFHHHENKQDSKAEEDRRKQMSVYTTRKEWDDQGVHHSMKNSVISENGGQIELTNVTLKIPPKSLEQSVLISVTEIDHDPVLQRKVISTGLSDVVQPGMLLCLKPHGQKFLKRVSLELDQKVPEGSSVLIFHQDVDHKRATEWTNITDECDLILKNEKLCLKIDQFSRLIVLLVAAAAPSIAVAMKCSLALLQQQVAQCKFYAYFKEPEEPMHVFVESMTSGDNSCAKKHSPESGYELHGNNVSGCALIDGEILHFKYNNFKAAEWPLKLDKCKEQGQKFILPKTRKTNYPPECVDVMRANPDQLLCELQISKGKYATAQPLQSASQIADIQPLMKNSDDFHRSSIDDSTIDEILRNTTRDDWAQCLDGMCSTFSEYLQTEFGLLDKCLSKKIVNYKQYSSIKKADEPANALHGVLRGIDMDKYPKFLKTLKAFHSDFAKDMIECLVKKQNTRR